MRSLIVLLLLAQAAAYGQTDVDSIMRGVAKPDETNLGWLDRSTQYLDGERSRVDFANVNRAWLLAGAYSGLGRAYARRGLYPGALRNYHGALFLLNGLARRNPGDRRVSAEIVGLTGHIRALGGVVPFYAPVQTEPVIPSDAPQVVIATAVVPDFPMPNVDGSLVAEADRATCEKALSRYISAAASAKGALTVVQDLRSSVARHGLTLRADYTAAETQIRIGMDSSRSAIEARRCADAVESLSVVSERVRRLLRELGQ